ncbi:MAG: protein-export chaperone SecB [Pseudomonadota bacterium]
MAEQPQAPVQPKVAVLGQYIRDLSFENVAIQKGVKIEGNPEVSVQVGLDAQKKGENVFEVTNKVNVTSKSGENTIFLLEMDYAGLFRVENVPDAQMHPYLMIECPRMIFPYLRRIVGDITRDGGFPSLNLDNIDYLALYQNEVKRRQAAQEASTENGAAN